MGLFSKKKEELIIPKTSSLPPLPPLPSIKKEDDKKNLPELPSFPTSSKYENINREMVKSAISDTSSSREKILETPKNINISQKSSMQNTIPELSKIDSSVSQNFTKPDSTIPDINKIQTSLNTKNTQFHENSLKENDPVFIRIDKFQLAQQNFEEIKSKVIEIESVLQKIKEVKSQEEEELKGWSEDVEKLKSRLAEIDEGIFNQL